MGGANTGDEAPLKKRKWSNQHCDQLLTRLIGQADAEPFLRAVSKDEVPDYYEIIAKPMSFDIIKVWPTTSEFFPVS